MMSLIFGSTWFQQDFRKLTSRQSIPGALFAITLFVSLSAVMLLIIVIPENLAVVTRSQWVVICVYACVRGSLYGCMCGCMSVCAYVRMCVCVCTGVCGWPWS